MRNELNNITSKLFKTDLATQKVELALIDDLTKSLNKSKASYKEFNDSFQKFVDFRRLVILEGEKYSKDANEMIDLYNKAATQAKELGLDFNSIQIAKDVRTLIASGDPSVITKTINNLKN
jgi:hypothetical protein